jgi:hypothetical protein
MSQTEALVKALLLALTARDDEQLTRACGLAEVIAQGMTPEEVDICKDCALSQWDSA